MSRQAVLRYSSDVEPLEGGFIWTSPALGFGWEMAMRLALGGLLFAFVIAAAVWPAGERWVWGMKVVAYEGSLANRVVMWAIGCLVLLGIVSLVRGAFVPATVTVVRDTLTYTRPGLLGRVISSEMSLWIVSEAVVARDRQSDDTTRHLWLHDASGYSLMCISDARGNEERLKLLAEMVNGHLERMKKENKALAAIAKVALRESRGG